MVGIGRIVEQIDALSLRNNTITIVLSDNGAFMIPGRGLELVGNAFIRDLPDDELAEFLRRGRAIDDPANKSGQAMLGMQSFAAFEEEHYPLVVEYLRQLNR